MAEAVHPDQEVVYTVEVRRPFELEPPHDGTNAEAITEFERELKDRFPYQWKCRVFARGYYKPPTQEIMLDIESLVGLIRGGLNSDRGFRRLMFLVGLLRERLDSFDAKDRKKAERALNEVRNLLGLT